MNVPFLYCRSGPNWNFVLSSGVLVLVMATVVLGSLRPNSMLFTTDQATSVAVAQSALVGEPPLLGPPSHQGGRHLSPIYFWYVTLGLSLGQGNLFSSGWIFAALNLLSLLLVIAILHRTVPAKNFSAACSGALLVLLSGRYIWILRDFWHANVIFIPALFVVFTFVQVVNAGWQKLPNLVLSATLLLQTHYSSAPFLAGVAVATVLCGGLRRRAGTPWIDLPGALLLGVALVSWVPTVGYELLFPSNILALLHAHAGGAGGAIGILGAVRLELQFLSHYLFGNYSLMDLLYPWPTTALALLAIAGAVSALLVRSFLSTEARALLMLGVCGAAAYLPALQRLRPPVFDYYLNALLPFPVIAAGVLFAATHAAWERSCGSTSSTGGGGAAWFPFAGPATVWVRRVSFLVVTLILTYAAMQSARRNLGTIGWQAIDATFSLQHAQEIAAILHADARQAPFTLLTRGGSRLMRSGILVALGPRYRGEIEYHWVFREIPQLIRGAGLATPARPLGYLLACPAPLRDHRRKMWKEIRREWSPDYRIDLANCDTCRPCELYRLRHLARLGSRTRSDNNTLRERG